MAKMLAVIIVLMFVAVGVVAIVQGISEGNPANILGGMMLAAIFLLFGAMVFEGATQKKKEGKKKPPWVEKDSYLDDR